MKRWLPITLAIGWLLLCLLGFFQLYLMHGNWVGIPISLIAGAGFLRFALVDWWKFF